MSSFYSIATSLSKFLTNSLKKSFIFTIIFGIGKFLEKQWVNSYFKSLYPNENFLSIFKRSNIIDNHLFAPIIVIFLFSIFLILSLNPVSLDLQINIAIAFISFFIGSMILPYYFFKIKNSNLKNNKENNYNNENNYKNHNDLKDNYENNDYDENNNKNKDDLKNNNKNNDYDENNYKNHNDLKDNYENNYENNDYDENNNKNKDDLKNNNKNNDYDENNYENKDDFKYNNKNNKKYKEKFRNEKFSFIKFKNNDIYAIGFCLVLVGIIFFFLSLASVGGIPLLKPSLRYGLKPILTMPVFLMIPGIGLIAASYLNKYQKQLLTRPQIRFRFISLLAIGSFFLFSLGYRTPIIAVLIMMIIISYYGKVLALWEIVIGALLAVGIVIGIGYFRSMEEFMISNTSPFYSLQSRADFTLNVLNLLNYISGDFGLKHGALTLSSIPGSELGPRMTIGKLIAWRSEVTVTPTLIGPMLVDFGRLGVAVGMGFLGFLLGIGYKILQKTKDSFYIALYAILLSYTILGIETGILDIQVIVYFILGSLIYLANIFYFRRSENKK